MKKTILVTGGAGFIGSNFIHHVLKTYSDYSIINIDCLTYAGNLENLSVFDDNPRYEFYKMDIRNKDDLKFLFEEHKIDYVVHFAAESHVDRSISNPSVFLNTNVMGTFHLLQSTLKNWCCDEDKMENNRFLHVSTDEVYGSLGATGLFTEDSPYQPNSPYSASKASSDHIVRSYYHTFGMPVLITNCSNNYGPFQFPEKLIPLIINNIYNKKPLPIYGKGLNVRDWLYVDDHCRAIMSVLHGGKVGECYNVGGNNEWTNIDIVELVCDLMDKKLNRTASRELITYVTDRPGHDMRYAIDSSKLQNELGWKPLETFETGIEKTITWYLQNFQWMEKITSGEYKTYYNTMYNV